MLLVPGLTRDDTVPYTRPDDRLVAAEGRVLHASITADGMSIALHLLLMVPINRPWDEDAEPVLITVTQDSRLV